MRYRRPAIFAVLLIGSCLLDAAAAESRWWPFGGRESEPSQPAGTIPEAVASPPHHVAQQAANLPADDEPDERWMIDSRLGKVSWPRLHLPELPKPSLPGPQLWADGDETEHPRNTWAEQATKSEPPSPLGAVRNGVRRVGDSTRAAWHKTVDVLTPGEADDGAGSRMARREMQPPWWKRMLGAEQQPQGPQTVTEWMAQDRLDP